MVFSSRFRPKKREQPIESWLSHNHHHHQVTILQGKPTSSTPSKINHTMMANTTATTNTTSSTATTTLTHKNRSSCSAFIHGQKTNESNRLSPLIPCYLPYLPQLSFYLSLGFTFIISCLCYINSLDGQLVHDDIYAIVENQDVVGNASWWQIFHHDFWGTSMSNPNSHKSYRPFTIATFRWNFYLHGLHPNGYHIVNIALHAMVCSIFLFICHRLLRMSIQLAFLTAILFAVHPIHTEAVKLLLF
ncbi:Transmembrane and TPR repeat-containing protein 1 [Trichoplax sp. H2]|nr:Transmembrane and TPR repeat-containing protein 1 [Trichoplax sp. H2]|eukprot:RDD46097.1 Transmembrane and TPR repeat-containing protein 1 [Trichoplax sp. H2]